MSQPQAIDARVLELDGDKTVVRRAWPAGDTVPVMAEGVARVGGGRPRAAVVLTVRRAIRPSSA